MNDTTKANGASDGAPEGRALGAHGQAALLLVESLIHGLIERSILPLHDAAEIVDVAVEIAAESSADQGDSSAEMSRAHRLLSLISESLKIDLPRI